MGWKAKMIGYDLEVFTDIRNDSIVIGITLCHYNPEIRHKDAVLSKRNRIECSLTTLNSAIAYCMCRAAHIEPGNIVLDPMVGSGIIPIEGSLSHPKAHFIASDISEEELKIAQKNIQNIKELHVTIAQASVTKLPFPSHSIDRIISDLPFGRRHLNATKNQSLYPKMLSEFTRITKPSSRIVLLTLERGLMKKLLPQHPSLLLLHHCTIDVGGLDAELYILQHSPTNPT
uniref:Ribosomal RNA large subunit methyltransferase K/L-like methyltransferase domain-containing protein n=1 Tax=Arcella intermedia TaxID=1963864 RepID=A0A6B2LDV1_9EUKA